MTHPHVERRDGFIVMSGVGTLHFQAHSFATLEEAEAAAEETAAKVSDVVIVLPAILFKGVVSLRANAE
ncbi:hypothetical protein [Limnoglobus roseus]|uniref:Uncharacterized protein n=1 Tax=Limnoglobus roseus TaxID=2598579 RepID=A0A5C1AQV3_9BACT|nr:hypothetical protein [Limnoglobus roseus]QEL19248.1 hypothetical protein PX52LOC_06310 [Limnoglobus roseus]